MEIFLQRIQELFSIGIEKFVFEGDTQICNYKILGKGTNSLVIKCVYRSKDAVVKILRLDSNRTSLELEADILKRIESLGLAPKIYVYREWFIVEEYIHGESFIKYTKRLPNISIRDVYLVIKDLLCKAIILDNVRVDHGELSRPKKHIVISPNNKVFFIDFESASTSRNPKNLTSILQYLLHHEVWRPLLFKFTGITSIDAFYSILKEYKKSRDILWITNKLGLKCF